ncbi:CHAD domain-containing protein [Georgenia alba]|uniref:CHAD domain-containing protein n=1 Tax=Georgenia alba TaxID=2233858 RepID=A0ABW2QBJ9_9MICO
MGSGQHPSAGAMLTTLVRELVRQLQSGLPAARADRDDAVHHLRTVVRRLRTALSVHRSLLDPQARTRLREGLAELGARLGEVRDLEVRAHQAADLVTEVEAPGDVRRRLVGDLEIAHADAHARLVRWCASDDAAQLWAELRRWAEEPPLIAAAGKPARTVARRAVRKETDRLLRRSADLDPAADLEGAHVARKAARRLRHTAEALSRPPVRILGKRVRRLGKAASGLQSVLGTHRDAVLLAAHARDVAGSVRGGDGSRAPYDGIAAAAERTADRALEGLADAVARVRKAAHAIR